MFILNKQVLFSLIRQKYLRQSIGKYYDSGNQNTPPTRLERATQGLGIPCSILTELRGQKSFFQIIAGDFLPNVGLLNGINMFTFKITFLDVLVNFFCNVYLKKDPCVPKTLLHTRQ